LGVDKDRKTQKTNKQAKQSSAHQHLAGILDATTAWPRESAQPEHPRVSSAAAVTFPAMEDAVMHPDTKEFNEAQAPIDRAICQLLAEQIDRKLPKAENKIWHANPVWFLDGNPIVGYSKLKNCVRLLFWSGQSFKEKGLKEEGTFKAAEARYTAVDQVDTKKLGRWLAEAQDVQWDYKNITRRKGRLERLK
jgi:hypothetical protein